MDTLRMLLRPVEVAEAIGVGRSKVYELIRTGVIPSVRVGSRVRVPTEALRAWIAAGEGQHQGRPGGGARSGARRERAPG